MTTNLSDELRQAVEQEGKRPVHVVDVMTNIHYVLMRCDVYEKEKALFEGEEHDFNPREAYPFLEKVMREEDMDDPTIDGYQSFAKRES